MRTRKGPVRGIALGCGVAAIVAVAGFVLLGAYLAVLVWVGNIPFPTDREGVTADITLCTGGDGTYEVNVLVANHTETTQSVTVTIDWISDRDEPLARAEVIINDLAAGASRTERARAAGRTSTFPRCRSTVR